MSQDYWLGPYDVRIPLELDSVTASDGTNMLDKNGVQSTVFVWNTLTKDQWLAKYADMRADGHYWYKNYWIGTYNVRVPLNCVSVKAMDGVNIRFRDGSQTGIPIQNYPTIEQWLAKFAELRADGHYWYIK